MLRDVVLLLCLAGCAAPGAAPAAQGDTLASKADEQRAPESQGPGKETAPAIAFRSQAIVLGRAENAREGKTLVNRWQATFPVHRDLFEVSRGYPKFMSYGGGPQALKAVVLGHCEAGTVESRLEFVRTLFPKAEAASVPADPSDCPEMPGSAKLSKSAVIEKDGWGLLAHAYLTEPGEGDGARREARDPLSGRYTLVAALFDPQGEARGYERSICENLTDLVDGATKCDLKITKKGDDTIEVQMAFDGPHVPCSGNPYRVVERVSFTMSGERMITKKKVLENKVAKYCD